MATLTGNDIIDLVMTNDKALGRALVVLRNRQTSDEVRQEVSKYHNDRGFRPQHAKMGTSMANYFERYGALTEKQANWWRVRGKEGARIAIYWRQLLNEAYKNGRGEKPRVSVRAATVDVAAIDADFDEAFRMMINDFHTRAMEEVA